MHINMKTLTYWVAFFDGGKTYNIRCRTKREVLHEVGGRDGYGPPVKMTVNYRDALDLVQRALGEGGIEY
jgi:hypothetical protein